MADNDKENYKPFPTRLKRKEQRDENNSCGVPKGKRKTVTLSTFENTLPMILNRSQFGVAEADIRALGVQPFHGGEVDDEVPFDLSMNKTITSQDDVETSTTENCAGIMTNEDNAGKAVDNNVETTTTNNFAERKENEANIDTDKVESTVQEVSKEGEGNVASIEKGLESEFGDILNGKEVNALDSNLDNFEDILKSMQKDDNKKVDKEIITRILTEILALKEENKKIDEKLEKLLKLALASNSKMAFVVKYLPATMASVGHKNWTDVLDIESKLQTDTNGKFKEHLVHLFHEVVGRNYEPSEKDAQRIRLKTLLEFIFDWPEEASNYTTVRDSTGKKVFSSCCKQLYQIIQGVMISITDYNVLSFKKDFCDYIQNAPRQTTESKARSKLAAQERREKAKKRKEGKEANKTTATTTATTTTTTTTTTRPTPVFRDESAHEDSFITGSGPLVVSTPRLGVAVPFNQHPGYFMQEGVPGPSTMFSNQVQRVTQYYHEL